MYSTTEKQDGLGPYGPCLPYGHHDGTGIRPSNTLLKKIWTLRIVAWWLESMVYTSMLFKEEGQIFFMVTNRFIWKWLQISGELIATKQALFDTCLWRDFSSCLYYEWMLCITKKCKIHLKLVSYEPQIDNNWCNCSNLFQTIWKFLDETKF